MAVPCMMSEGDERERMQLKEVEGIGRALVAGSEGFAAGEVLLKEEPTLVSPSLDDLDEHDKSWVKSMASFELNADVTWVLNALAYARANLSARREILTEFCSWSDGADDTVLHLSGGIIAEADRLSVPLAHCLGLDPHEIYAAFGVMCLNAHNVSHGRSALYTLGSKFAHVRLCRSPEQVLDICPLIDESSRRPV